MMPPPMTTASASVADQVRFLRELKELACSGYPIGIMRGADQIKSLQSQPGLAAFCCKRAKELESDQPSQTSDIRDLLVAKSGIRWLFMPTGNERLMFDLHVVGRHQVITKT